MFDGIYKKRKRILIKRDRGGFGDILMHRMIFEDFKLLMPECELTFACPDRYISAVEDHPFIDNVVDSKKVNSEDFAISYDTKNACMVYELAKAPFADKHRSDIWAEHCGVNLTKHDMHITFSEEEKKEAEVRLNSINPEGKKVVVISPVSAMQGKNLEPRQINRVIESLKKDYFVFITHHIPVFGYSAITVCDLSVRQYMALVGKVDYVISVDTSMFHLAGGLGKPMVAVFGWADGKVYSKYFPKTVLVQKHRDSGNWDCGPCFNYGLCPKSKENRKPCITEITEDMILSGFNELVEKNG